MSRSVLLVVAAALAVYVSGTSPARAAPLGEPPPEVSCGRVAAYVPPIGTQEGSVVLSWRAQPLAVQFGPPSAADLMGRVGCVHQRATTSGPRLEVDPIPAPFCGRITTFSLTTPSVPDGILVAHDGLLDYQVLFARAPGTRLPAEVRENFSGCFDTGMLANGYPTIVAVHSTTAPATPPPPSLMPNTSTADDPAVPLWLIAIVGLALRSLHHAVALAGRAHLH